jgi:hypothetical protein
MTLATVRSEVLTGVDDIAVEVDLGSGLPASNIA